MGYAFCLACDQFHVSANLLRPSPERVKHTELWDSFILTTCKGSRKGRPARRLLRENQVCSCLEMKREAKCTMGLHRNQGTKGLAQLSHPRPLFFSQDPTHPSILQCYDTVGASPTCGPQRDSASHSWERAKRLGPHHPCGAGRGGLAQRWQQREQVSFLPAPTPVASRTLPSLPCLTPPPSPSLPHSKRMEQGPLTSCLDRDPRGGHVL